jgi:hypothetical protein
MRIYRVTRMVQMVYDVPAISREEAVAKIDAYQSPIESQSVRVQDQTIELMGELPDEPEEKP